MQNFLNKYERFFEAKAINLIEKCFAFSIFMCLFGIFLLAYYNTHYISSIVFTASITIFRTGLMVGLFPIPFTLVIGKWKSEH